MWYQVKPTESNGFQNAKPAPYFQVPSLFSINNFLDKVESHRAKKWQYEAFKIPSQ